MKEFRGREERNEKENLEEGAETKTGRTAEGKRNDRNWKRSI